MTAPIVEGSIAAGFEPVRRAFTDSVGHLGAGGAAYCASVDGTVVVDLWAGEAKRGEPWRADTTAALYSAGKGAVALCALLLAERGLDIDERVSSIWPEFAAAGKDEITVRQLLSHQGGLTKVPGYAGVLGPRGEGWADHEWVWQQLAGATPQWQPGAAHGYHALTFGYLVGAIVHKVTGERLGSFFRREIGDPLGIDVWIGAPDDVLDRLATTHELEAAPPGQEHVYDELSAPFRDPADPRGRAFLAQDGESTLSLLASVGNSRAALRAGVGSGDATGTARGLARMYSVLACDGELDGRRVASPSTIAAFADVATVGRDRTLGYDTAYGVGMMRNTSTLHVLGPGDRTFGHAGAGGQLGFCDPALGLAVGFTRSHLSLISPLGQQLVSATYDAIAARRGDMSASG